MDGNFVAMHQQQHRTTKDVWIKDGEGYMTRRAPYHAHLRVTEEEPEVLQFITHWHDTKDFLAALYMQ